MAKDRIPYDLDAIADGIVELLVSGSTLNIDLLATEIPDFVAHFREYLQSPRTFIEHVPKGCRIRWQQDKWPDGITRKELYSDGYITLYEYREERSVTFGASWSGAINAFRSLLFMASATRFRTDRLRIVFYDFSTSGAHTKLFLRWIKSSWGKEGYGYVSLDPKDVPIPKWQMLINSPPIPGTNGYTWDDLFDWWYRGGRILGYPNVKDLAQDISNAVGTVNNNHSKYKDEYGSGPMPDSKSKFAKMVPHVNNVHDDE